MKKLIKFFKSLTLLNPEPTQGNSKKEVWKFIIQTIISILTAILTALGATSCVRIVM